MISSGDEVGQLQQVPAAQVDDGAHASAPSSGVTGDWAGHAVAAAASAAELLAGDREDLDAGLRELRVRRLVALVGDDDAGLERDDVVAVVPLRALRLELVAARS